jgi:nitroreductase
MIQKAHSLYKKLPEPLRRLRHTLRANCTSVYWLCSNALFDTAKYARFSASLKKQHSQKNHAALLTFYYHKIEKGLALPSPKPGFGSSWIVSDFLPLLKKYFQTNGADDVVGSCRRSLEEYVSFHAYHTGRGVETVQCVLEALKGLPETDHSVGGGTRSVDVESLMKSWAVDFASFANARHSIRNFSDTPVEPRIIEKAVAVAQRAPSVCNRQSWRVYALLKKEAIQQALKLQNGNAGFGEKIPCLLLVTGDVSTMLFSYERNQVWIDGGLFSMALIYALQSMGLASCCLNLCLPWNVEKKLAALYQMPQDERPIMMIAVGHLPDHLLVAHSQRQPLSAVLTWSDQTMRPD